MSEYNLQLQTVSSLVNSVENTQKTRKRSVEPNKRQQTKYISAIKYLIGTQDEEFKHEHIVSDYFRNVVKTYIENHQYAKNTVKTGNSVARNNRQTILNQLTAAVTLEQFKEIREGEQLEPIINPLSIIGSSAIIRRLKIKTIERKLKTAQAIKDRKHIAKLNKVKQKYKSRFGAKRTYDSKEVSDIHMVMSKSDDGCSDSMNDSYIVRAANEKKKRNATSGKTADSKVAVLYSFTDKGDLNSQGLAKLSIEKFLQLDLNGANLYGLSEESLKLMRTEAIQLIKDNS